MEMPEEVAELKRRVDEELGWTTDPMFNRNKAWELRYVNQAGRHLFSIHLVQRQGGQWRVGQVSECRLIGRLHDINVSG